MKPNFALSLSDTSIALLHRTAKGWTAVGETPFDAPDLAEALDYLRKSALGLEPAGISSKLVIPNGMIRYAEVTAPGPSEEERRAQVSAALEELTGLKADEMAFDFSGRGAVVKVAAVAKETLAEAEGFASEHRFNPVSFVALPDPSQYSGEPWFGVTAAAKATLQPGEVVERDRHPISITPPRSAEGEAGDKTKTDARASARPAPAMSAQPGGAEVPPAPVPDPAAAEPAKADAPGGDAKGGEAAASRPAEAPKAEAAKPDAPKVDLSGAEAPAAARPSPPAHVDFDAKPAPAKAEPAAVPPPPPLGGKTVSVVEEAPFTHVADAPEAQPEAPLDDLPPMPAGLAGRTAASGKAGITAPGLPTEEDDLPPPLSSAALSAQALRRGTGTPPPLPAQARPDAAALARAARGKPIEDLPPVPRPVQAATLPGAVAGLKSVARAASASAGGEAARGLDAVLNGARKGKAKVAPPAAARVTPPAAATSASAAAAGAAPGAAQATAGDAARSLARSPFGKPVRGRPRYMGLILTAILLLCLALVAAWSSIYLATAEDEATSVLATEAAPDAPAVEDEMLADAQDPSDFPAGEDLAASDPAAPEPEVEAVTETAAPAALEEAVETAGTEPEAAPLPEAAPDTGLTDASPDAVTLVVGQDEIFLATAEAPPPAFDALSLPNPDAAVDAPPGAPMPPPPEGTVYRFDSQGLIQPTPAGIPSPDGYTIYEGAPDVEPPARSAAADALAVAAREAEAEAAAAAAVETPARPGEGASLVATAPAAAEAEAATETAAAGPEAQPNPDLADRRPRERPVELTAPTTADDDAALEGAEPTDFAASLRPRERPQTVLAAGERARADTASASLAAPAGGAVVETIALSASDAANPSVLAISRRPAVKPDDFSRAVEAAVAAAVRAPDVVPEPEPVAQKTAKAPSNEARPEEHDEEPEVAAAPAPKIPTKASVAKQATFKNAINMSKTNLIGVYGTQSKRYALVRLSGGKYKKVSVGDRIDGGTIQAITQTEVRYQKGGRLVTLAMPKG